MWRDSFGFVVAVVVVVVAASSAAAVDDRNAVRSSTRIERL
jgi:hypothetical protein